MDPTTVPRAANSEDALRRDVALAICEHWNLDWDKRVERYYAAADAAIAVIRTRLAALAGSEFEQLVERLEATTILCYSGSVEGDGDMDDARTALLAAHGAAVEQATGPGTPSYRLAWLLDELARRFPEATMPLSSRPPEPFYLAAIDNLIETQRSAVERAREEAVTALRRLHEMHSAIGYRPEDGKAICGECQVVDPCPTLRVVRAALATRRPDA